MKDATRSTILEWWRNISDEAKIDYTKSWQQSLPEKPYGKKHWSFELVNASTGTIEEIYHWIKT